MLYEHKEWAVFTALIVRFTAEHAFNPLLALGGGMEFSAVPFLGNSIHSGLRTTILPFCGDNLILCLSRTCISEEYVTGR
jgi:hypothetical protein